MRIVIDMQGAQIETRIHGVGRYTMSFAQSAVLSRGEHQVILALSGLLPDTIEPIRAAFDGLLPQDDIRVWHAPGPADGGGSKNEKHCRVAELIREAFLASLRPDVIHISNLSDGLADHAVTSIGRFDKHTPVTVAVLQFSYARQGQEGDSDDLWRRRIAEVLSEAALCYVTAETESTVNDLGISADRIRKLLPESESDTGFQVSQIFDDWATVVSSSKDVAFRPTIPLRRPRLAYVSPLPPERTGIADYSAELLPALAEYYDIEVVVAQDQVTDTWVTQNLRVRDVAWLRAHEDEIDRVLYHIGNSQFHAHMLTLLKDVPGVIVLHDFYLGHLWGWMDQYVAAGSWARELYSSHGYSSVRQRYNDTQSTVSDFPCSFGVLGDARGVIVHSEHSRKLERHWFGEDLSIELSVIPLLRVPVKVTGKNTAKEELGFSKDDFVICSFGFLGETKLNHRLIDSWLASVLPQEEHCHLVFVGENDRGEYGAQLLQRIKTSGLRKRIRITGYASPDLFRRYLRGADLAVQLRTKSRGETSAAVLDCMNYGLPLIVNANGSMAELDRDAVWMLSDDFDDHELIEALEGLWREPEIRHTLGRQASAVVHDNHSPAQCAKRYAEAIENSHRRTKTATKSLLRALASHELDAFTDTELLHLSRSVAATFPVPRPAKRLFLDVSATCRNDLKTGIERVARALLLSFMDAPPSGYRIEPVYLDNIGGEWLHRHARRYTLGLLECPVETLDDDILEPECGDILLVLDLSGDMVIQAQRTGLFGVYHNKGVAIFSIVFDLLPVQMPEMFPPGADQIHWRWLQSISGFSGVMCISKAVADGLAEWLHEAGVEWKNRRPCQIGWFHLGDDVASSAPSQGLPTNAESTIVQIRSRPSFLMVGTIEPRKGYLQTIEAFCRLWQEDVDVNLVIVGKEGWKDLPDGMRRDIPQTISSLRTHRELHRRLFWLEGISDEYLEAVYASSTCLIAASYGEGFGLPLIEAAQHKLAIIARDIPVFREVGGEHAYYFHGRKPGDLADAVVAWLSLHANGKAPRSDGMRRRTWRESAEMLADAILEMRNTACDFSVAGDCASIPDHVGIGENVKVGGAANGRRCP